MILKINENGLAYMLCSQLYGIERMLSGFFNIEEVETLLNSFGKDYPYFRMLRSSALNIRLVAEGIELHVRDNGLPYDEYCSYESKNFSDMIKDIMAYYKLERKTDDGDNNVYND